MPEDKFKRRLRMTKRRVADRLAKQNYQVSTFDSGPFDVMADRGRRSRRITLVFGPVRKQHIEQIENALAPDRCRKEIWSISHNGRRFSEVHITKHVPHKLSENFTDTRGPDKSYVYFIHNINQGLVKIGKTNDAPRRFKEISNYSFDPLSVLLEIETDDACALERALHRKFSRWRIKGEWFKYSDAIKEYIQEHVPKKPVKADR